MVGHFTITENIGLLKFTNAIEYKKKFKLKVQNTTANIL